VQCPLENSILFSFPGALSSRGVINRVSRHGDDDTPDVERRHTREPVSFTMLAVKCNRKFGATLNRLLV